MTWRECAEEHTELMIRYHSGMKRTFDLLKPVEVFTPFSLDSFRWPLFEIDWRLSQVFVGPSGCGKTSFARALLPRALFVRHKDKLAEYDTNEHDGIIFDDMCFTNIHRTHQIHLVDNDHDTTVHIRYVTADIPKNTKKIFTSNVREVFNDDPAINRRVKYNIFRVLDENSGFHQQQNANDNYINFN